VPLPKRLRTPGESPPKGYDRECLWCGKRFHTLWRHQRYCGLSCAKAGDLQAKLDQARARLNALAWACGQNEFCYIFTGGTGGRSRDGTRSFSINNGPGFPTLEEALDALIPQLEAEEALEQVSQEAHAPEQD